MKLPGQQPYGGTAYSLSQIRGIQLIHHQPTGLVESGPELACLAVTPGEAGYFGAQEKNCETRRLNAHSGCYSDSRILATSFKSNGKAALLIP